MMNNLSIYNQLKIFNPDRKIRREKIIFHPPNLYSDPAKILRNVVLREEVSNLMRD